MRVITKNGFPYPMELSEKVRKRYRVITKVINQQYWQSNSEYLHSLYVGSYGRGTALKDGDIDILIELPVTEFNRYDNYRLNGQSSLLSAVRHAIKIQYPNSDIRADGQVIKINFYDGMNFEILPSFKKQNFDGSYSFVHADSNSGGTWKPTDPKREQEAIRVKNNSSRGLLVATARAMRAVRNEHFSSYKLPGIVIDSFVYSAMGYWEYTDGTSNSTPVGTYEKALLDYYQTHTKLSRNVTTPGSNQIVELDYNTMLTLEKVLEAIEI